MGSDGKSKRILLGLLRQKVLEFGRPNRNLCCFSLIQGSMILLAMVAGCFPEGEIQPQPLEKAPQSSLQKQAVAIQVAAKGLPDFCRVDELKKTNACIKCEARSVLTRRCFETYEQFDPGKKCKFTDDYLKCLINKGPKLIAIRFGKSGEEQFLKNFGAAVESLTVITNASESLSPASKNKLRAALVFTKRNLNNLISGDSIFGEFAVFWRKQCSDHSLMDGRLKKFKKAVFELRKKNRQAILATKDGFDFLKSILELINSDDEARSFLASLNTEGMSDY